MRSNKLPLNVSESEISLLTGQEIQKEHLTKIYAI